MGTHNTIATERSINGSTREYLVQCTIRCNFLSLDFPSSSRGFWIFPRSTLAPHTSTDSVCLKEWGVTGTKNCSVVWEGKPIDQHTSSGMELEIQFYKPFVHRDHTKHREHQCISLVIFSSIYSLLLSLIRVCVVPVVYFLPRLGVLIQFGG